MQGFYFCFSFVVVIFGAIACGKSWYPDQEVNLHSLHWKHEVLTATPPRQSRNRLNLQNISSRHPSLSVPSVVHGL